MVIEGVLHIALRSDARPTVVQDEDTLVPAVVRPHPDDLDGTSVEVAAFCAFLFVPRPAYGGPRPGAGKDSPAQRKNYLRKIA